MLHPGKGVGNLAAQLAGADGAEPSCRCVWTLCSPSVGYVRNSQTLQAPARSTHTLPKTQMAETLAEICKGCASQLKRGRVSASGKIEPIWYGLL